MSAFQKLVPAKTVAKATQSLQQVIDDLKKIEDREYNEANRQRAIALAATSAEDAALDRYNEAQAVRTKIEALLTA